MDVLEVIRKYPEIYRPKGVVSIPNHINPLKEDRMTDIDIVKNFGQTVHFA